jgi:hypothetical protein
MDKVGALKDFDLNNPTKKDLSIVGEKAWNSGKQSVRVKADVGDELTVTGVYFHKLTDHFRLRVADTIQPLAAIKSKSFASYNFGVSLDFIY